MLLHGETAGRLSDKPFKQDRTKLCCLHLESDSLRACIALIWRRAFNFEGAGLHVLSATMGSLKKLVCSCPECIWVGGTGAVAADS